MKTCPSCGRKLYLQEKYCPACNYYLGNVPDVPTEPYYQQTSKPTVTCPYCQSTDCAKISGLNRAVSIGFWGLMSKKIGKQWHCNECGSDF